MFYWQSAAALLALLVVLPVACLSDRKLQELWRGEEEGSLWRAKESTGALGIPKIVKNASSFADSLRSTEKKGDKKKSPLGVLSVLLKGGDKKKMRAELEQEISVKKRAASNTTTGIDAKYKFRVKDRCGDPKSYYLPALNECYRIYRTPKNNLDRNFAGYRNSLAYGTTMYDYMYNCRHLFKGKLLDIGFPAIGEKMKLVRQMAKKFYKETKQRGAIQVGFMISKDLELMSQNGTFYDVLDGVIVKMNPIRSCRDLCCVNLRPGDGDSIEMFQVSCAYARAPNFICQKQGKIKAKGQ